VKAPPTPDRVAAQLEALESSFLGLKRAAPARRAPAAHARRARRRKPTTCSPASSTVCA
jgi:hypothetical protein